MLLAVLNYGTNNTNGLKFQMPVWIAVRVCHAADVYPPVSVCVGVCNNYFQLNYNNNLNKCTAF